jgi:hypothetical protein
VAVQGLAVVAALVAEERAKLLQPLRSRVEQGPVVVSGFVAQVTEHRAVTLPQLVARRGARHVVGLQRVDRDHAAEVARGDEGLRKRIGGARILDEVQ